MNAAQRTTLANIRSKLDDLRYEIQDCLEDEQTKFDNMPESLQGSDRGVTMEEGISTLEEAIESVQAAIDALDNLS